MEKMKFETPDGNAVNITKIAELFPAAVSEGKVNFEMLRTLLGDEICGDEAYEFTWVGKREAIREAGRPIRKTLRPCPEESKEWDTTENLYIEGDNLDVLKLLQESYLGKVKMIYIDPPYNTGNDFVYRDNFTQSRQEHEEEAGVYDDEGNRLFKNTETNGRFHSDWCSMIYPRLVLARNLLRDDGVIFISIDDNEVDNLKKICFEIFGESNFVACVVWQRNYAPISLKKYFSESHEYCLVFARIKSSFKMNLLPRSEKQDKDYKNIDNDPRGVWKVGNLTVGPAVEKQIYAIEGPTGRVFLPPKGYCWRFTKEKFEEMRKDNRIWFGADGDNSPVPKLFLTEVQNGVTPMTLWLHQEAGHNQDSTREVRNIFNEAVFTNPKPVKYITRFLHIGCNPGDIILDFFSGSATTAHAVMQLNAEDGGRRKFIMVQLPEVCDPTTEAAKAGYKNICEIGKERIRRAGEKILEELTAKDAKNTKEEGRGLFSDSDREMVRAFRGSKDLDVGFRVLKLDESNMKDVYFPAGDYSKELVEASKNNIKEDRSDMDLLYGCLLEWGLPLSLPHTQEIIGGVTVHTYNGGSLMACFADTVSDEVVREIARRKPLRAVFRDSSFKDSPSKINVEEIFKLLAPGTSVKVI